MSYSKSVTVLLASVVCLGLAADADAQSRGRSGGGRSGGGSRGPSVGRAVPRGSGGVRTGPVYRGGGSRNDGRSYGRSYDRGRSYGSRGFVGAPLRSYYYPYYGYGRYGGYGYRSGLSIGLSFGYPYGYGYPYYGYRYGYPYGAYGYSYGGYYPAGYGYAGGGYGSRDAGYGGIRIQGAVRNAEVYVDGYYAGIVDDFDGSFQRLDLEGGAHTIEIRAPGFPPLTYDVNVQPGQTVTVHANVR
jgi:hypothetical protein